MIQLNVRAAVTNFNATYTVSLFLVLFTVIAMLTPSARSIPYNLLMSLGLVAAISAGLLAGTTITEIKVKPLSFVMPGQERSMGPAALVVGGIVCAVYALLVFLRPMSVTDISRLQQAVAALGFDLGIFMLVVGVCVLSRATLLTSVATSVPFMLIFAGMVHESTGSAWIALNLAVAERPLLAVVFGVAATVGVYRLLGNRRLSRDLCGAPFLPLKAYDNPFRLDDYRNRMRRGSFRPSVMTSSGGGPASLFMKAVSRYLLGTSWDYLLLDSRASRNQSEFVFKLVALVVTYALIVFMLSIQKPVNGLGLLFFLVTMTFMYFPPTFRVRLSPMLPVARRQHFKVFVAKALSVYAISILMISLLELGLAALVGVAGETNMATSLRAVAGLPFKATLVVAAVLPIFCWAFTKLRSTIGFLGFMIVFVGVGGNLTAFAEDSLLAKSYTTILLATAVLWLPFLGIAWKRCFRDDLYLP